MTKQPKPKKCKGTAKDTYGLGCGSMQKFRKLGLGLGCRCYQKFLLNTPQGRARVDKGTLSVSKDRRELEKAAREYKESKRLPEALKQTQIVFNKYIRLRDRYRPCISSGSSWNPDFDAGHLFSVKQYNELRFDEDNVHGQSIGDNRFKEGNFEEYITNLPVRIGQDRFQALLRRAERAKQRAYKWTVEELAILRSQYKQKIKDLENGIL